MQTTLDICTYDKRLLPHIVDERAKAGYSQPYAKYPTSTDPSQGFISVSYACLANAVNRACWWLKSELSGNEERENPFAYLGPNDLRYIIFVLAAMKTGRQILICSLRNTVDAQLQLFQRVNCKCVVSCSSMKQSLEPLFNASANSRKVEAPSLTDLLSEEVVPHYAYGTSFETCSNDAIIHCHTSGSSGNPKPISWNKDFIYALDSGNFLPPDQGKSLLRTFAEHQSLLMLLRCFHAGGLGYNMYPAFYEMILVLGHPAVPMSAQYVADLLKYGSIDSLLTPPSILEDLSKDPCSIETLTTLNHIGYGGGPLNPMVGQLLATKVPHVFSIIGATEYGWFHNILGDNKTWDSSHFYSDIGYRFDEISEGIYELVIDNDPATNQYHGIFETFPTLKEYRMRDLYTKVPDAPGWMKYLGRADDLIVLSNGEKINPIPLEHMIATQPLVEAALVIGEYRFNPSLLVEAQHGNIPTTDVERGEVLNAIWPMVEDANKIAPSFSRIPKSLILFATTDKPFLRAGKGTVQRQLTVKAYEKELDHLYSSQESSLLIDGLTLSSLTTSNGIKKVMMDIFSQALEVNRLKESADMFQLGMDSLRAAIVVSRLKAVFSRKELGIDTKKIEPRLVYISPSIAKMTESLLALSKLRIELPEGAESEDTSRVRTMKVMLEKYLEGVPSIDVPTSKPISSTGTLPQLKPWKVIITGTTGSLGSYILNELEAMPESKVTQIYCFNRSKDGLRQQERVSASRGLSTKWSPQRVQFYQSDLSLLDFGLSEEIFTKILQDTTLIIHCAWQVDFNLSLESFEPQIRGVKNLLDFSHNSANKAPLVFISSISTALGLLAKDSPTTVPENVLKDFDVAEEIGYAESKFISENIISQYTKSAGVNAAILRTGQIAGPLKEKGVWKKKEWFPSMMTSSKYLGAMPASLGPMEMLDWVPVDSLSSVIVELAAKALSKQDSQHGESTVYNLVNPRGVSWSSIADHVAKLAGFSKIVTLLEWVQLLEESGKTRKPTDPTSHPALKLVDFFKTLSKVDKVSGNGKGRYKLDGLV